MKCANCGKELREGALFCGGCGMKIVPQEPVEFENSFNPNNIVLEQMDPANPPLIIGNKELSIKAVTETDTDSDTYNDQPIEDAIECCKQLLDKMQNINEKYSDINPNEDYNDEILQLKLKIEELNMEVTELNNEIDSLKKQLKSYICPNCGNSIAPYMKFCNSCGFKLSNEK